ncbi:MAG: sulfatase-like hydrolase/transferase, partial [Planctomycetes bacterium]|nr:sulfatase-like hydrolase/transferase [Planctomycetota bacterium]
MAKSRSSSQPKPGQPNHRRLWILAAVALAALAILAFWLRGAMQTAPFARLARAGDAEGYNVLLVTLDTLRPDRLGCYGYTRARTPAIDSLADFGVLFEDAVTCAPLTLPSHATILTGLYPPHHGVRDNGRHFLTPDHVTLAETLKEHGYDTAAFVGCFVLDQRVG